MLFGIFKNMVKSVSDPSEAMHFWRTIFECYLGPESCCEDIYEKEL